MKMRHLFLPMLLVVTSGWAQNSHKHQQDREAILSMQGCYKVEFRYAEIFATDTGYQFPERDYTWAYEWITPVVEEDNAIVLQHLLSVNDTTVVKHWRQDWLFQNQEACTFYKDYTWLHRSWSPEQVKGQWTQVVSQVDDSPRYVSSGTWVHVDGKHYWEARADAPLPRREKKANRHDYNVMVRNNRQEITDYGWIHKQENEKVMLDDRNQRSMVSFEKGWNTYTRVDDTHCKPSVEYWEKTHRFWKWVRAEWEVIMREKKNFTVQVMSEDGFLYANMFTMAEESTDWSDKKMQRKIKEVLQAHVQEVEISLGEVIKP